MTMERCPAQDAKQELPQRSLAQRVELTGVHWFERSQLKSHSSSWWWLPPSARASLLAEERTGQGHCAQWQSSPSETLAELTFSRIQQFFSPSRLPPWQAQCSAPKGPRSLLAHLCSLPPALGKVTGIITFSVK